jgi:hypothetical protein
MLQITVSVVCLLTWSFDAFVVPGGLPSTQGGHSSIFLMTVCWIAVALVLYLLRPSSLRNTDDSKPHGNGFVCTFQAVVNKHSEVAAWFITIGICNENILHYDPVAKSGNLRAFEFK